MTALQGQDIVLAIYLHVHDERWTFQGVADVMGISASQVHMAWGRLVKARLAEANFRRPINRSLVEFLCHGVRFCFPPTQRGSGTGMVTAHGHPAMKQHLILSGGAEGYVWTGTKGRFKGICVDPLHKSSVNVAKNSQDAYAMLAILDSIRLGRPREREVAISALKHKVGVS